MKMSRIKIFIFILTNAAIFSCTFSCTSAQVQKKSVDTKKDVKKSAKKSASEVVMETPRAAQRDQSLYAELDNAIANSDIEKIKIHSSEILLAHPQDLKALNSLAMYYYQKQQVEAALTLLNKSLTAPAQSSAEFTVAVSAIYNNLGLIELAKNNKQEALKMFRQALEIDRNNYIAATNAAAIYLKEKDYKKIIITLEGFINSTVRAEGFTYYAIALHATGKPAESAEIFEKILKIKPDSRLALLHYSILLIETQAKYKEGLAQIDRLKLMGAGSESRQIINNLEIKAKAGLK